MIEARPAHPLKYFATVLSQMTATLRDFNMYDTAALLEQAKADIEHKLGNDSATISPENQDMHKRDGRL
jgi:hypothetical protein